ncbi:TPA: hypothetical protein DEP96_00635 [Candidatus Uhrbacteria bacterium]|nr:hypothetical protein [Candidatus Uhrbacteria bacterium]
MADRQRIVILGGGFAGVNVARHLAKSARNDDEIILLSSSKMHTFTPWLYEIAAARADEHGKQEKRSMAKTSDISLDFLKPRVAIREVKIAGLDLQHEHVLIEDGKTVRYDALVIALGSEMAYFGIPGLQKFALTLKTTSDALAIRRKIAELVADLRRGDKSELKIVIGGAGPSGVELAAEIATMFTGLERRREIAKNIVSITLVDGGERVLGMMTSKISRLAEHRLRVLGVKVILRARINEVKVGEVLIKAPSSSPIAGGEFTVLPSDCTIWTGGVQPAAVLKNFALPKDPRGRILVESTFEVQKQANIFALGDAAMFVDEVTKQPLPQTAQAAENVAPVVAGNVLRALRRTKLEAYKARKQWPYSIAVGGNYALLGYGNLVLSGWLGYVIRRLVDLRYFLNLLPLATAVKFWVRGVLKYRKND